MASRTSKLQETGLVVRMDARSASSGRTVQPNRSFIPEAILALPGLTLTEKMVLALVIAFNNNGCYQSNRNLAAFLGCGVTTVKQAIRGLKAKGYVYDIEVAKRLFNEALEGRCDRLGDDHPDTLETKNDLAVLYKEQARYDEAESRLIEAIKGRRLKLGDTHARTLESWHNLIELYEAWGKPEKANEWRAKLPRREGTNEQ